MWSNIKTIKILKLYANRNSFLFGTHTLGRFNTEKSNINMIVALCIEKENRNSFTVHGNIKKLQH